MDIISNLSRKQSYLDYSSNNYKSIEIDTLNEFHRSQIISKFDNFGINFDLKEFDEYDEWNSGRFKKVPRKFNITIVNVTEDIFNKIHNILFKIFVVTKVDFYGNR